MTGIEIASEINSTTKSDKLAFAPDQKIEHKIFLIEKPNFVHFSRGCM